MNIKKGLTGPLVVLGLVAIIGASAGLGVSGVFNSNDSPSTLLPGPTSTPAPSPTTTPTPPSDATEVPMPGPDPTDAPAPTPAPPEDAVQPDPNFQEALKAARFNLEGWKTDFSRHTVPYDEILQAARFPRDGSIPAIDKPLLTTLEDADLWLGRLEPVVALEINGDARAYPLQILTWHEVVNDVVGGVPVIVTFCPLCNSAIAFSRTVDGVLYDFGVSGNLRNSDLIMYDRQTHSWWQQLTGEGIVGELAGKKLNFIPASIISWEDFREANPEGRVLSRETGFTSPYGTTPMRATTAWTILPSSSTVT